MKYILCITAIACSLSVRAQFINGGVYKIKNAATGKYLKVGDDAGRDVNGLFQYPFLNDNAFKWIAVRSTGTTFKLKNIKTDKFIAVSGGAVNDGAAIIHYQDAGQADLNWLPIATTTKGRYKLRNNHSSKMMAVEGGNTANGARIIQWSDNNQPDIVWIVEATTPSPVPEVRVAKNQWQFAMNLILLSMKLRINNYTPTAGQFNRDNTYKFTKPNDCSLKIGLKAPFVERTFDLAPSRFNPATLYFNDINKRTATVEPSGNTLKITMTFEEAGQEVLGNCIDNIICGGGMWWIDLANVRVEMYLEPTIVAGKLTYKNNARAVVTGKAASVGMNVIVENLNNAVIFEQASAVFTNILNREDIRQSFTEGLNSNLSRLPVTLPSPLVSVRLMPGGELVFR
jgi:hypothetical protein